MLSEAFDIHDDLHLKYISYLKYWYLALLTTSGDIGKGNKDQRVEDMETLS